MKTITIAHISDLHINHRYYPERTTQLHETLSECEARNVDHLIITGDLAHLGEPEELEHCASILREHGYWDNSRLTVTIGNHDIFGGPYFAEDVITFPGKCRETDYDAKLNAFNEIFAPSFASTLHGTDDAFYPFAKLIGDIALVGINTVARWSVLKNPLGSNGAIDDLQFDRMTRLLNDSRLEGRRIFLLAHHHFHAPKYSATCSTMEKLWERIGGQTEKFWRKKKVLEILQSHGVEKILHGHIHEHSQYREYGITCLNAGASMIPQGRQKRRFHIITTEPARMKVKEREGRQPALLPFPGSRTRLAHQLLST